METEQATPRLTSAAGERLALVVVLALIFLAAARTPLDTDLWWHLRSGELTWTEGKPLLTDPFSFTRQGQPWVNHSWLSQLGLYLLFTWGGFPALGALMALLATASMALVYRQMQGPALLRAFLLVLSALVAAPVWSPRPQLVSLVLFGLLGYLLYLFKWQKRDRLLWILPLMVLWSNLHGGYPLGLMLIGLMAAGETLNHLVGNRSAEVVSWAGIRKLVALGILSALLAAVNPNGVKMWLIPFQTVGVETLQRFVSEWASPDFHDLAQQPLLWLTFALFLALGLSKRPADGTDLLMVIWFGFMAFLARRNFGPFAMAAAPMLSRHAWPALARLSRPLASRNFGSPGGQSAAFPAGLQKALNLTIVALLGLAAMGKLYATTSPVIVGPLMRQNYPAGAVDWLRERSLQGRVLNEYAWGGYLDWAARDLQVFVDGRTDLFGDEVIGDWMTVVQAGEGWQQIVERRQVDLILLQPDRPVVPALEENGWRLLYRDDQAVLYGR